MNLDPNEAAVTNAARSMKLLNRDFFLLWQGQFISRLGTQVMIVALVFWIKRATGSATLMGVMQMIATLPAVLLGPVGGTFADRYSRRSIIILSDILRGVAMLSLSALIFLRPSAVDLALAWLFAVLIVTATITAFFEPAISAAIPDLVPQSRLARANSLGQLSFQLSVFIGQGIGGTLFRLLGAPALFLINGLSYLVSATSESFISIPQVVSDTSTSWKEEFACFKRETVKGFRHVWRTDGLREMVFVSVFLVFFTTPVIVLLPFYVEDFLGARADWYGFMLAAYGAGSLIGYLTAGTLRLSGRARGRWMIAFIILQAAGYGLLGLIRDPVTALAFALLGGATGGFVTVHITTILQITTPGEMRGRVFGVLATISNSLAPVAMGLAGVVADAVNQNIPLIYISCGAAMTLLTLLVSLSRRFRDYLTRDHEAAPPPGFQASVISPE
jgi:MFS family permease